MNKLAQSALYSALILVTNLMLSAPIALACAVCGAGDGDATRDAFSISTGFLSFIPLIAIGGVIYTVYRYTKNNDVQS